MKIIKWLILAACLLQLSAVKGEQPNILLIMADDVGTDAIGCYGGQSYPTPHIDALATGGMKFDHAYAMPVCHPSRICLMTGRYPFRFGREGSKWGDYPKAAEGNSIGDVMKQGGYATAVAGKWQLCLMKNDVMQPQRTGFDEWCLFGWHEGARFHDPMLYQNGVVRQDVTDQYGPDLYVEFLTDFMQKSADAGKPFFAYYPMALCHDVTDDLKGKQVKFATDDRWMTYGEMVASMDDMIGRLVKFLDRSGLRENTIILFTTDNGTAGRSYLSVNEEGKMVKHTVVSIRNGQVVPGGKGKLDDTGTRVPLIANWPGKVPAATEVGDMVDLTDLLPTCVELAGLESDGIERDGISFSPTLLGRSEDRETRDWVYIENRGKRCIRSKDWKLYPDGRFYDMNKDPAEKSDLSKTANSSEAFVRLKAILNEMKAPR